MDNKIGNLHSNRHVQAAMIEIEEAARAVIQEINQLVRLTPVTIPSEQCAVVRHQLQEFRGNGQHSVFITSCVIEMVMDHFVIMYSLSTLQRDVLSPDS